MSRVTLASTLRRHSSNVVAPDPLKIRYRTELRDAVREIVLGLEAPTAAVIERETVARADPRDREKFAKFLETDLRSLHAGNFARFRLRQSEFEAWEGKVR